MKVKRDLSKEPISGVEWVHRDTITCNNYNPNSQPPPEFRLLKVSILQDGFTQPIVVFDSGDGLPVIVDGEHRWRLSADKEMIERYGGMVPVVRIKGDQAHLMMSTIRHNRARGEHAVLPMADIVRKLLESGMDRGEVGLLLQMEDEEIERLSRRSGMPEYIGKPKGEFSKSWMPEDR